MITKLIKFLAIFFVTLSQNLENFNQENTTSNSIRDKPTKNTPNTLSQKTSQQPNLNNFTSAIQKDSQQLKEQIEEIIYDGSQIMHEKQTQTINTNINNKEKENTFMESKKNVNSTKQIIQQTEQEIIPRTAKEPLVTLITENNNDFKEEQPILIKETLQVPQSTNPNEPTLLEVEQMWEKSHFKQVTKSTALSYQAAFKYLEPYYDWPFTALKFKEWQTIVNKLKDEGKRFGSQKKMKCLCGQLCSFAIKNEIATTNYGPMLELDKNVPLKIKVPFSIEEIQCLWQHKYWQYVDIVLLLIYTGVRAGEFLRIDVHNDVFLDEPGREYFIVRQSKTQAGTNRPIPIHKDILPLFQKYAETKSTYMFSENGEPLSYAKLRQRFEQVMRVLNMSHTPHECRHTLATLLDNFGANDLATKKILGHAARGVTKSVYSHKTIDDLFKAINTIQIRKPRPTKQAMPSFIDNSKVEKKETLKWV